MIFRNLQPFVLNNLSQIPGWRTKRKIIVIESDDWGSVRMPSREVYFKLLNAGIRVDNCHYCKYDSLESEEDLALLFEVLTSVADKNGNPAVITANALVANPDFERIRESNFSTYYYKKITQSFKEFKGCENALNIWKQGQNSGCFIVQSHGREHLNVARWMHYLKESYKETRFAFDHGVYGLSTVITSEKRKSFLPAFNFETEEEEQFVNQIAQDALNIFEELFGYRSKSFMAPNYNWGKSLEKTLGESGVRYIQGSQFHRFTEINNQSSQKRLRYFGKRNLNNQIDLVRNASFEPSEKPDKNCIDSCLAEIEHAFQWGHPATISSHRVNYMGSLDHKNRDKNLVLLKQLLSEIATRWPDIEFMSSVQLGEIIVNK